MNVAGLIFSNIHDQHIPNMTNRRTMASIPFGCRYRLIDFALSNMVNSDITNVGVITHYNYQSLLDHIGTGKDWDLARRSGGIKILPPYVAAYENAAAGKVYSSRLEAILGAQNFINRCGSDYIVLSDCDVILNIDLSQVLREHIDSGAFITIVTKKIDTTANPFDKAVNVVTADEDRRVLSVAHEQPEEGIADVSTNILVISRNDLQTVIAESLANGYKSFVTDIINRYAGERLIRQYPYDGWYAYVGTLESYFSSSMKLLEPEAREQLFNQPDRRIYTKIRNSAPARYAADAKVTNSLVADGCVIEGTVENSILFRGVKVGRGTVIRNSILLQDTFVGGNVQLNCVISDKNVIIKDGRLLSGHQTMPFFIGKGTTV